MKLYSYCLRIDDGAAPNPFWGVCTLVICKPAIRRKARVGDWIVGHGSVNSPVGDVSDCVVYAMRVSQVLPLKEYDAFCHEKLRGKVPDIRSHDFRRRVGDCIYDFSAGCRPHQRAGVHDSRNHEQDLSGINALVSEHFFYFGDNPIRLPRKLHAIIHRTQGHKCHANDPYVEAFESWIKSLALTPNTLLGEPQRKPRVDMVDECGRTVCAGKKSKVKRSQRAQC